MHIIQLKGSIHSHLSQSAFEIGAISSPNGGSLCFQISILLSLRFLCENTDANNHWSLPSPRLILPERFTLQLWSRKLSNRTRLFVVVPEDLKEYYCHDYILCYSDTILCM